MIRSRILGCFLVFGLFCLTSGQAFGQLISPGKLTAAHADLEGVTNCTQCHTLGNRSADNVLCLDCHTPLAQRIEEGRGLHATVEDQNCATCHKDHFGVEFIPVRMDTLNFDHDETGYELTGSHIETSCRSCHQPEHIIAEDVIAFKGEHNALEKTFLGLADQCIGCHLPDSPHQEQFEETNCDSCHETEIWEEAPAFDHDDARFALTGKHVDVSCESCHATVETPFGESFVQYVDLEFASCNSCHEDIHEGAFGSDCASCHQTEGWFDISGMEESAFDHSTTGFDLVGNHAQVECASCHGKPARDDEEFFISFVASTRNNTYPEIKVINCESCHVDYHEGEFADLDNQLSCEGCHGQDEWYPSTFDLVRHNEESSFELTGSHIATPCSSCHRPDFDKKPHFEITDTACKDCHIDDNPHGEQFITDGIETTCETCHLTEDWLDQSLFDHDDTEFPLTGQHSLTECNACHVSPEPDLVPAAPVVFRSTSMACVDCHTDDDPHQGQFEEATCNSCHNTTSFLISSFNHDETRFPLTGEHVGVACGSCHQEEEGPDRQPFTRFKPLGIKCEDCHGE